MENTILNIIMGDGDRLLKFSAIDLNRRFNYWYISSKFLSIVWNGVSQVKVNYCKQMLKNKVIICQNSVENH